MKNRSVSCKYRIVIQQQRRIVRVQSTV
eukprot:COSAG06_NODE_57147_length_281_cov_1.109890_1_plen_27_part_01